MLGFEFYELRHPLLNDSFDHRSHGVVAVRTDQLIKIAAERELKKADALIPGEGLYQEFVARFPYEETDDLRSN